jgi:hypothetical protein
MNIEISQEVHLEGCHPLIKYTLYVLRQLAQPAPIITESKGSDRNSTDLSPSA